MEIALGPDENGLAERHIDPGNDAVDAATVIGDAKADVMNTGRYTDEGLHLGVIIGLRLGSRRKCHRGHHRQRGECDFPHAFSILVYGPPQECCGNAIR
ncbi:hypothetical protein [Cyanobium sp. LEGE 06113]|uniref:hypothetical protein n=1 Tax=Cyanobium sp. LEGE 06113 TaxID=1297573 RepID=UPI00187E0B01|nr:hypothetical protein [Cyanobium sp. LEGE 06113]MBE9154201.1 hypothetical protein [Cyanobium sp. LEGE 06113]